MSLKFLFNAFPTSCQGGGAIVKLAKIRERLEAEGHHVELFDQWKTKIEHFDLYHHFSFFPEDWPIVRYVAGTGVPIAVETMYWASWKHTLFSPATNRSVWFRRAVRYGLRRALPQLTRERMILRAASVIMVNSAFEKSLIARDFKISPDKIAVCLNGVDKSFIDADPDLFKKTYGLSDFVLVTGMFEERKNQLALIRAMRTIDAPLVLIGGTPGVHRWYYDKCKAEAGPNVHFIDYIDHDDPLLRSAYACAKVLALPSWHETTGKSALEGGLLAKNVVMTTFAPAAKEYLEDMAIYVDPGSVRDINTALRDALGRPPNTRLQQHVLDKFTWETVLNERLNAYLKVLNG